MHVLAGFAPTLDACHEPQHRSRLSHLPCVGHPRQLKVTNAHVRLLVPSREEADSWLGRLLVRVMVLIALGLPYHSCRRRNIHTSIALACMHPSRTRRPAHSSSPEAHAGWQHPDVLFCSNDSLPLFGSKYRRLRNVATSLAQVCAPPASDTSQVRLRHSDTKRARSKWQPYSS